MNGRELIERISCEPVNEKKYIMDLSSSKILFIPYIEMFFPLVEMVQDLSDIQQS